MNAVWTAPSSWPALPTDEAHVWLAHLPAARTAMAHLTTLLSRDEAQRAQQFRFDQHRERWQFTRAILRSLLGRYLDATPQKITFALGEHGKPRLERPALRDFHFNTSHSGDYAAFAFTRVADIGVDIEQVREDMTRREEIARRYFAPGEWKHLESLPERERARAFFDLWTRKEAFVKARGDGLFSGLDQFEVSLANTSLLRTATGGTIEWSMSALPEVEGYSGAVVVKASSCVLKFYRWHARQLTPTS
jgi:4'-phosphopantetheinyl transferase